MTEFEGDDAPPPPRWFPMHIAEEAMDVKLLSIESRGALYNLALHYFHKGGLPHNDRMVRRIADVPTRKWNAVETELKATLFTNDWRHKRWDKILADMEGKRRQARQASAAGVEARRRGRPALTVVASSAEDEDCPF